MNWEDLKTFAALAQFGSVRAAGEELGISPSQVARRIDRLETTLGVSLFYRLSTGSELTDTGKIILKQVKHIEKRILKIKLETHIAGAKA